MVRYSRAVLDNKEASEGPQASESERLLLPWISLPVLAGNRFPSCY